MGCQNPLPKYTFSLQLTDHTRSEYANCFDEAGTAFLNNVSATEVHEKWLNKETDPNADLFLKETFEKPMWNSWEVKLKVKKENYNDNEKIRLEVLACNLKNASIDGKRSVTEWWGSTNG